MTVYIGRTNESGLNIGRTTGLAFVQTSLCLQIRFKEQDATLITSRILQMALLRTSSWSGPVLGSSHHCFSPSGTYTRILLSLKRGSTWFGDVFLYASTFTRLHGVVSDFHYFGYISSCLNIGRTFVCNFCVFLFLEIKITSALWILGVLISIKNV